MNIVLNELETNQIYHLFTQTVTPRPVAWVLTDSGLENYNLAPFSYFTPIASNPPVMMFSVGKKPNGEIKDTIKNAKATEKLVIHIASTEHAKLVTDSAATLEHGESEVTANNIALVPFEGFELPRVKDCAIAFGCSLYEVQEMGETPQSLVFAKVEQVYVDDSICSEDDERLTINAKALNPLSRLGGAQYAAIGEPFSVQRPK
ncbi:flavin reductase family protein [Thaumasiovibrio subtropicus]|uniref:flavin reductase family protein n=1 Tax=Thaumasiovibrio subtropicus TaxID=1891207 RepID=UPI000B34C44E|nr:flavin reductase family protein [Thaumasiovibrio subtropicus]